MEYIGRWLWQDKESTESTNDDAYLLSKKAESQPFIISAQQQTQGRGRYGRSWVGLEGNLFFSQSLVFNLSDVGQLIFISSLSLCQTIQELCPLGKKVQIKWPNDILIDNAKVSGTLLESGENGYLIIGIGVNICAAPKTHKMLYATTSLREQGISIDRVAFLKSYIKTFEKKYKIWQQQGFSEIKRQWLFWVKGLNEEICVHTLNQEKKGIFEGVGEQGELLLKTNETTIPIYAGDVFYIKKENR